MARRNQALGPDDVPALPGGCGSCLRWERFADGALLPIGGRGAGGAEATAGAAAKRRWWSEALTAGRGAGVVVRAGTNGAGPVGPDGGLAGYVTYLVPDRSGGDALTVLGLHVDTSCRGLGLGRVLVHAVARAALRRPGVRAVEALAAPEGRDARDRNGAEANGSSCHGAGGSGAAANGAAANGAGANAAAANGAAGNAAGGNGHQCSDRVAPDAFGPDGSAGRAYTASCLVPLDFWLGCGFTVVREHPFTPRVRLDTRVLAGWRTEVEGAFELAWQRLRGAVRPDPAPGPALSGQLRVVTGQRVPATYRGPGRHPGRCVRR